MCTLDKRVLVADDGYSQALSKDRFPLSESLVAPPKPNGQPCTTNMCRFFSSFFLILSFSLLMLEEAGAVPLQTLTVPANGTQVQSNPLTPGDYNVTVSGTYVWGKCDPVACPNGAPDYLRWADPVFLTDDHWDTVVTNPMWTSNIYFEINGSRAAFTDATQYGPTGWHTDHTYHTSVHSNGGPATFAIHDCLGCYGDNSGFLTAEIMAPGTSGVSPVGSSLFSWSAQAATVPEPGSLGLLGTSITSIIGLGLMRRRRGA